MRHFVGWSCVAMAAYLLFCGDLPQSALRCFIGAALVSTALTMEECKK